MKIFVASTYQDLQAYRAAATRSILMAGNLSEDMSYWPAGDSPPLDVSRSRLGSSDLMILLIAHRYGAPPEGHDRSITELEFDLAETLNLPILAFRVDPEYPWPPRHVETEPEVRARLETFLRRVSAKVTIGLFTTPESLEVAVTHALVRFMDQRRPVALPRYAERRLVQISRAESLRYSPDSIIKVGHAPDGASLLLSVRRTIPATEAMDKISFNLGMLADDPALGIRVDDPVLSEISSRLNQEARNRAAAYRVYDADWKGQAMRVYVPNETMTSLMASNLFQSIFQSMAQARAGDERRPVPSIDSRPTPTAPSLRTSADQTSIVSGHKVSKAAPVAPERVESLGGKNRFLCIALEGDQPAWTGGWTESTPKSIVLLRPFIEEGLERLDGVRYVIEHDTYLAWAETLIDTESPREAIEKWVTILSSEHDQELKRCSYKIRIPRSSVIRFTADVIDDVAEMHDRQEIHGDIKPSNTLISRNGKTLIDEVNLGVGDISPTVTLGWSPSEQLLRQPLSCAADIFPLGQMLLHILDGEPLGKEVCYRLPGGKKATLVEDPAVYISDERIPPSTRNQWCRVIERALRTDPRQRWPHAGAMGEELRELADREDVPGFVDLTLPWGRQPSLIDEGKGALTVGWVMHTQQPTMRDRPPPPPPPDPYAVQPPQPPPGPYVAPAPPLAPDPYAVPPPPDPYADPPPQPVPSLAGGPPDGATRPDFISISLLADQAGGEMPQRDPLPLGAESPDAKDLGLIEMPVTAVEGVYCKNGHFNDPEARYCAVCGISMGQVTKVRQQGPRPPLGVLILGDGSVCQLEADYVIGREPTLDSSVADGHARPLRLMGASEVVSRIHARVDLDGWQVFLTDLNSANGTQVLMPGERNPTNLQPGVRTPLVAGAQIRLGGEFGLQYDSHRQR
jgi:hypothetical protein